MELLFSSNMATLSIHRKTLCFELEAREIEVTNANSIENTELSSTKSQTHETPNIETNITVTPNIPTGNRFPLLQIVRLTRLSIGDRKWE